MRVTFSMDEVYAVGKICSQCQFCSGSGYCIRYKTDSIVFKVHKCMKLDNQINNNSNNQ